MRAALSQPVAIPALARQPLLRALLAPTVLALAMLVLLAAVPPAGDFPVEDDWNYGNMVRILARQGRLEIQPWTSASVVVQLGWGALFAHVFGFSFNALRASTLVLAAAGVFGCYLLFRVLLDEGRALLGSLLLLFNPLYVFQSYSFLTDVPFVSLVVWALVFYTRALRRPLPGVRWLVAGSTVAAAAFLVRQIGLLLPLCAFVSLIVLRGWRTSLRPSTLMAIILPLVPAYVANLYVDAQKGPLRQDFVAWNLGFWFENPGLFPAVVVSRMAGAFTTLGLFLLPVCVAWLLSRPSLGLSRSRALVVVGVMLLTVAGLIARVSAFGENLLFPHLTKFFSAHGFAVRRIGDTLPQAISTPSAVVIAVTALALLGSALLALLVVSALPANILREPAATTMLFGTILLALTVSNRGIPLADRYLLPILPTALLVGLLAVRSTASGLAPIVVGVLLLAGWSIWWEREYLERRDALWLAGQAMVERGIPAEEIDGGFEWNGWYRGETVIPAAVQRAREDGQPRSLDTYVLDGLLRRTRWTMAFVPPDEAARSAKVLVSIPYWQGQRVVGWQRT